MAFWHPIGHPPWALAVDPGELATAVPVGAEVALVVLAGLGCALPVSHGAAALTTLGRVVVGRGICRRATVALGTGDSAGGANLVEGVLCPGQHVLDSGALELQVRFHALLGELEEVPAHRVVLIGHVGLLPLLRPPLKAACSACFSCLGDGAKRRLIEHLLSHAGAVFLPGDKLWVKVGMLRSLWV